MGLSTHILDTGLGKPAGGVPVELSCRLSGEWASISQGLTDADGRCRGLLAEGELEAKVYRLRFETEPYFTAQGLQSLYPFVEITFAVRAPEQHYHIPLLIAANGYSTYRGS